jgi:hypothetical protein
MLCALCQQPAQKRKTPSNAPAHREPPKRGLSVYAESQHGGDAVAREVRACEAARPGPN